MSGIGQKGKTSGEEAPYHLRKKHDSSQSNGDPQGADVRVIMDVAMVVMTMMVVSMLVLHVRVALLVSNRVKTSV